MGYSIAVSGLDNDRQGGAEISRQNWKSPSTVSDQILWMRKGRETTPMHILKLVYLCHGWLLGLGNRALIHEPVEAWRYGPVVPSVYHAYKLFGGQPVNLRPADRTGDFDSDQMNALTLVDSGYGHLTAVQLSALTHRPGTPWDVTRKVFGVGHPIANGLIRDHFRTLAKNWELL